MCFFIATLVGRKAFVVFKVGVELIQIIFSHTLDATARRDSGLLLASSSCSPSLRMGIILASFHLAGNVLVSIEQLIISVKGPSMTGKQSFSMQALTLSGPGDLFSSRDATTRRTSSHVTVLKSNRSPGVGLVFVSVESSRIVMLFSSDRCRDESAAFLPTLEKNRLNLLATTLRFWYKLVFLCL